ncbi:MAG: thiamine phosphate synthase, partial [Dehalococcoidales bacterium]
LTRREKLKLISGLYVIIDTQLLKGRPHLEVAGQAISGGARTIQLRDKVLNKKELITVARQIKALCAEREALFIMNDYLDIALDSDADGLHLGQDDLPVRTARGLLPPGKIIGCSTTSPELAIAARADGADYIAIGAIYPTSSKISTTTPAKVVGLETLRQVRQAIEGPIVAIGGITGDNISEVMAAGADSAAVISAVVGAESPEAAARKIVENMELPA